MDRENCTSNAFQDSEYEEKPEHTDESDNYDTPEQTLQVPSLQHNSMFVSMKIQ